MRLVGLAWFQALSAARLPVAASLITFDRAASVRLHAVVQRVLPLLLPHYALRADAKPLHDCLGYATRLALLVNPVGSGQVGQPFGARYFMALA